MAAAINIKNVDSSIISAWMESQMIVEHSDQTNFVTLLKMTDAEKIASLVSYLNTRVSNNSATISGLAAANAATTNTLTADSDTCSAIIATFS